MAVPTLAFVLLLLSKALAQSPSDYPDRVPGSCSSTAFFDCGNGQCIPFTNVRNCVNDCPDGSDEQCGQNQELCDANLPGATGCGTCFNPTTQVAELVCRDRRWQRLCTEANTWACTQTQNCVYTEWVLDGENDCADWSDEITECTVDPCVAGRTNTCDANAACAFAPATQTTTCTCNDGFEGTGQACTAVAATSSTSAPTTTATTTAPTTATTSTAATTATTTQPTTSTRQATTSTAAPTTTRTAAATTTTATAGTADPCTGSGQFRCRDGNGCVPDNRVLDGVMDCADGSDENSCTTVQVLTTCAAPPAATQCAYSAYNHTFNCGCADLTEPNNRRYCMPLADLPKDCGEVLYLNVDRPSGIETVYTDCVAPQNCNYEVTCDQTSLGGGWLVIQRQINKTTDFGRTWQEYKSGFGNQRQGDYWIGNEYLYQLSNNKDYEVMLLLLTTTDQILRYRFKNFRLEPESDNYRLRLGPMSEGIIDEMRIARNQQFSANDRGPYAGCAQAKKSGWWWEPLCLSIGTLNQKLDNQPSDLNLNGMLWAGVPIKGTAIMLREQTFVVPPSKQEASSLAVSAALAIGSLMLIGYMK